MPVDSRLKAALRLKVARKGKHPSVGRAEQGRQGRARQSWARVFWVLRMISDSGRRAGEHLASSNTGASAQPVVT